MSNKQLLELALITDISCKFAVNRYSKQPQIPRLCSTTQEILKRNMTVTPITHCVSQQNPEDTMPLCIADCCLERWEQTTSDDSSNPEAVTWLSSTEHHHTRLKTHTQYSLTPLKNAKKKFTPKSTSFPLLPLKKVSRTRFRHYRALIKINSWYHLAVR